MNSNTAVYAPRDGKFVLRAKVIGANPASIGSKCFFGLDAVVVQKL